MPEKKFIKELTETGIIDIIGNAISIQDTDFKVLYQNMRHKEIVGNRIGEYCYTAYQGKDQVCEGCHLAMSFKDGQVYTVERSRSTDDGITYSENTSSVLKDSRGNIVAGIEVIRDITARKKMEIQIIRDKEELEERVNERTEDLICSNKKLMVEISERNKIEENLRFTEKELIIHLKELKELNIALKVLLKQREDDQRELENNILSNLKHLVFPYLTKLKKNNKNENELVYLKVIESNLYEIVSPFSAKLYTNQFGLTTREIQIADLIKDGRQDKEIMDILNISLETVKTHRKNIRKKLGIYGKRINLRTHLVLIASNR